MAKDPKESNCNCTSEKVLSVNEDIDLFLLVGESVATLLLAKCGGEAQHLEKLEIWSPPGLPNV
jgi:hypothetical protein